MTEEINGEIIEYDFYGFENAQAAEEMKKGKIGKLIGIGNSMTPVLKSRQPVIYIYICTYGGNNNSEKRRYSIL